MFSNEYKEPFDDVDEALELVENVDDVDDVEERVRVGAGEAGDDEDCGEFCCCCCCC